MLCNKLIWQFNNLNIHIPILAENKAKYPLYFTTVQTTEAKAINKACEVI